MSIIASKKALKFVGKFINSYQVLTLNVHYSFIVFLYLACMIKAFAHIRDFFRMHKNDAADPMLNTRKYKVNRPVELGRFWVNDDPFATAFFNSLSVSFPHAEVFMIDSIKPWREHMPSALQHDVDIFMEQELNHSREHVAFNRGMAKAGYEITTIEKDVVSDVKAESALE